MTSNAGRRAVVLRYAGKREWTGVFYRMLRFFIENRERSGAEDIAGTGGGGGSGSDA